MVDPRFGVPAIAVIIALAMFVLSTTAALAAVLSYLIVWYFAAGGRAVRLLSHFGRAAFFVLFIVLLNGLLVPGEGAFSLWGRTIVSRPGLAAGVFYAFRLLVLYAAVIVFHAAVTPEGFARWAYSALEPISLRLARRLALGGFLAASFFPLFAREVERVRAAQSFRGAGFNGGLIRRIDSTRLMLVPLILSAVYRSGQLAAVVELRDLKNRIGAAGSQAKVSIRDYAFAALTLVVLAVVAVVFRRPPGA